jgi:hypothetical protein
MVTAGQLPQFQVPHYKSRPDLPEIEAGTHRERGHAATSRKVAASSPDEVDFFQFA